LPPLTEGVGYMVYGRIAGTLRAFTVSNNAILLILSKAPIQATTFLDDGTKLNNFPADTPQNYVPPVANTSISLQLLDMKVNVPAGGGGLNPAVLATFTPCSLTQPGAGQYFGNLSSNGGGASTRPDGEEWVGNTSPLSQLVPFNSAVILALGNNHPVKILNPNTTVVTSLVNNFSATIPDWAAARTIAVDDLLLPTVNNAGAFIFKAIQGGVTGAAVPGAFPQLVAQQVADGGIIWENTGTVNSNPAPRGAAHALQYAGSLLLLNTAPVTTADGLDGPNVIAFSDFNNASSWNPRNRVRVAADDGQQIQGGAYFAIADTGIIPTGGLVVFRDQSTYIVLGFPPNEQVVQVQTDKGCIAGRTIKYVPGLGIVRLTHLGWAAYDGVTDKLVDFSITNLTQPTASPEDADLVLVDNNQSWFSKAALTNNPVLYACAVPTTGSGGALTDAYCLDTTTKSWLRLVFDWGTCHVLKNLGILNNSVVPPAVYVGDSANKQIVQFMTATTYATPNVQTMEVFSAGHVRMYYRRLTVRGYCGDGDLNNSLTITMNIDGVSYTAQVAPLIYPSSATVPTAPFVFEAYISINMVGLMAHATITTTAGSKFYEFTEFDWDVSPISAGVPVRLY
jgi:hypothetical protein